MSEIRHVPSSLDSEKGFLGSVLLAPSRILDEYAWVKDEHFHHFAHQVIFRRVQAMREAGVQVDLVTLTQHLDDHKADPKNLYGSSELEKIGGAGAVADLFTFVPTASNARYYAEILHEKFVRRKIIEAATRLIERAYEDPAPYAQLLEDAEGVLTEASGNLTKDPLKPIKDILPAVSDEIEACYHNRGKTKGLETGLKDFDRMTLGIKPQSYTIIGARPGNAKTALIVQMAAEFSKTIPVAIFSLEMTENQIGKRLLCMDSGIDLYRTKDGFMSKKNMDAVAESYSKYLSRPIYIDETPRLTVYEFRARARRAVDRFGVQCIMVDYLQLLKSPSKRAQESLRAEITDVSMGVKATAKELGVAVIACAQLNRDPEGRNSRPRCSDLKESGQIEQDADLVVLLHRPDPRNEKLRAKKKKAEKQPEKFKLFRMEKELLEKGCELIEAIFGKQRDGPTGAIGLGFKPQFTRFVSLTEKLYSNDPDEQQINLDDMEDDE